MSETVTRRGPRIVVGALLIVAGLVVASVMWIASGERRSSAVEDLARAPVGCDTTLDFVEPGSYLVFIETSGELADVRGDCAAQGDYDVGPTMPDAEITVVDPEGIVIDLGTDVDDVSYDDSGFVGAAAFSLDVAEADDHVIRVESPGDEVFVVAIGGDPSDGVVELRIGALAVGVLGVLLGGMLMLLGRRRGRDDEFAPQWSAATPMGRPELFTPGQAPSGPPTYGPPTYGPPPGRLPSSPPAGSSGWAPHPGWEEPRPSFGEVDAPSPVPPPPPPNGPRTGPSRPRRIPGEPDWVPSPAPPTAPPPAPPPPPPAPPPPPERRVSDDHDRWASPEGDDGTESSDPRGSTDGPTSPQA